MFTRICKVLSPLLLVGCVVGGDAPTVATLAGGDIAIAGPRGFCVDERAMQRRADGGIVVLASCASITQSRAQPQPDFPAVLMASVSGAGEGLSVSENIDAFRAFFQTPAGRATLSQDGQAETVAILNISDSDGVLYIRLRDSSESLDAEFEDTYWRALFDQNQRIVSASVFSTQSRPLTADLGRGLIRDFVTVIQTVTTSEAAG